MRQIKTLGELFIRDMPYVVKIVLTLTVFMWVGWGVKKLEPILFPVVDDFKITEVERDGLYQTISGTFNKLRDCRPLELVGYHNQDLLFIDFLTDVPPGLENAPLRQRVLGPQTFKNWQIIPPVQTIRLYVRHSCSTGSTITLLYDGPVVAYPGDE